MKNIILFDCIYNTGNKRPSGPRAHLRYEIRGPAMCLGHLEGGTVGTYHEQYLPTPTPPPHPQLLPLSWAKWGNPGNFHEQLLFFTNKGIYTQSELALALLDLEEDL